MLKGQALDDLVEDIREHGQKFPIVMHGEVLLDGRNRLAACERLGIEPKVVQWDGEGSELDFIVSVNLQRRHMTCAQLSKIAVAMEPMFAAEAKERKSAACSEAGTRGGRGNRKGSVQKNGTLSAKGSGDARTRAANAVGVSTASVQRMRELMRDAPDLAEQVEAGERSISGAYKELKRRQGKVPSSDSVTSKGIGKLKPDTANPSVPPPPPSDDRRVRILWKASQLVRQALRAGYSDIADKHIAKIHGLIIEVVNDLKTKTGDER